MAGAAVYLMAKNKTKRIVVYDVFREMEPDIGEVFTIITPKKKIKTKRLKNKGR